MCGLLVCEHRTTPPSLDLRDLKFSPVGSIFRILTAPISVIRCLSPSPVAQYQHIHILRTSHKNYQEKKEEIVQNQVPFRLLLHLHVAIKKFFFRISKIISTILPFSSLVGLLFFFK